LTNQRPRQYRAQNEDKQNKKHDTPFYFWRKNVSDVEFYIMFAYGQPIALPPT